MSYTILPIEQIDYRLVLISAERRQFMVSHLDRTLQLPRISIPKWARPAEVISREVTERWGLKIIILDLLISQTNDSQLVLAEIFESTNTLSRIPKYVWCSTSDLPLSELHETEMASVKHLLEEGATGRGPFSRLGWIDDAISWLVSEIPDRDFHFDGECQQVNAHAAFTLVRFGNTKGRAYWLKAVGEPNLHELSVTQTLARTFPEYLPEFVAARPEWNAWIMKSAGTRLTEPPVRYEVQNAVIRLAELQKSSIGCENVLKDAGCFDQRDSVIRDNLPRLVELLILAMSLQSSTKAPQLSELRLREIGSILGDATTEMEALGLPSALIHNDFGFGNILFDVSRTFFIDWAEAGIGIPTVTYQHLKHYASRDSKAARWVAELDDVYKGAWRDILSERQIDRALVLSPLLALASHLLGRGTWMDGIGSETIDALRYMRGLARHMDAAAANPSLLEALCL